MKRTHTALTHRIAAFGFGVLLSIILPSNWMLIVTVVTLIAVAVSASMVIRG